MPETTPLHDWSDQLPTQSTGAEHVDQAQVPDMHAEQVESAHGPVSPLDQLDRYTGKQLGKQLAAKRAGELLTHADAAVPNQASPQAAPVGPSRNYATHSDYNLLTTPPIRQPRQSAD